MSSAHGLRSQSGKGRSAASQMAPPAAGLTARLLEGRLTVSFNTPFWATACKLSCHMTHTLSRMPPHVTTLRVQDAQGHRWDPLQCLMICAELARREERFAEKAPSASARAKAAEPGEVPEANGRLRRPSEAGGRKEPSSAALPAPKAENSRPSREHRPKERDTAVHKERDSGTADRNRNARPAGQKEEASGQLADQKQPAQNGKGTAGKQVERDAEQKAKSAARSSQKSSAPADELVHKSASQPEERAEKPAVELDSLRERALSSRRPAAKQGELADPAGEAHGCVQC